MDSTVLTDGMQVIQVKSPTPPGPPNMCVDTGKGVYAAKK